jgi:hypothetical protein
MNATQKYDQHVANILDNLQTLQKTLTTEFKAAHKNEINWAQVGTMAEIDRKIKEVTEQITRTGEYAE